MSLQRSVIEANITVHSKLAANYRESEPHFRPENVAKVERRIAALAAATRAERLLDLGCGTGFVIDIAKRHVRRITGVDVTAEMLARVDRTGPSDVELVQQDTGSYEPDLGAFQLVTAYSFLHHLGEVGPTLRTAARALAPGGKFYADLEPNFYFWSALREVDSERAYHPVVGREIDAVLFKAEEIQSTHGIPSDVFRTAEYGKDVAGGFKEEDLRRELMASGFSSVEFHYEWFLGEAFLINGSTAPREQLLQEAAVVTEALQRALPVSRALFKYLGFVATR